MSSERNKGQQMKPAKDGRKETTRGGSKNR